MKPFRCLALGICVFASAAAFAENSHKFAFGGEPQPGWTSVAATNFYTPAAGFGFERGAAVQAAGGFVASDQPFYFSVKLPEGNYRVTAVLGGETESTTTVKAELRRLVLEKVQVAAGKSAQKTFVVNVRTSKISGRNRVRLKPRERTTEMWNWDEKLTLEFNGAHPSLRSLEIEKADVPTVFLLGDSTVCDQPAEPWNSWGQMVPRFFKPEVAVANHAESGETLAGSLRAKRFDKVFSLMKPGDYLFVQFGHNDQKNKVTNALATYKTNLKNVIARTRKLGGMPVLVTSMERKSGVEQDTLAGYPQAMRDVAKEENCALIDLNAMSRTFYRALRENVGQAFQDGTHHNNYGSYELAKCVVAGVKQAKLPLAKFITDDFGDFDPAKPDAFAAFEMPASPTASKEKPLGN